MNIIFDTSPYGIGAVLTYLYDQENEVPVAITYRTLECPRKTAPSWKNKV